MLKKVPLFAFMISVSVSFAQSNWRIQSDLEYHFQQINLWRSQLNADSASSEDSLLRNRLFYYAANNAETIKENFKYLKYYDGLRVLTADDNSFRIYSWDDGSKEHHNFVNVFQYQGSDKKVSASLTMPGMDASTLKGRDYRNLYTVKAKGRVYYLATYIVPRDKDNYSMGVDVYSKDANGTLNDSTQIIVDNTYGTPVSNLDYTMTNASGATNHSIYYNKNNKTLYVPIIWKDCVVSSAYTEYRFKNNYFTEIKEEKKTH